MTNRGCAEKYLITLVIKKNQNNYLITLSWNYHENPKKPQMENKLIRF